MHLLGVLEYEDVTTLIFRRLDTTSMVTLGRVSRAVRAAQRSAIRNSTGSRGLVGRGASHLSGTSTKVPEISCWEGSAHIGTRVSVEAPRHSNGVASLCCRRVARLPGSENMCGSGWRKWGGGY